MSSHGEFPYPILERGSLDGVGLVVESERLGLPGLDTELLKDEFIHTDRLLRTCQEAGAHIIDYKGSPLDLVVTEGDHMFDGSWHAQSDRDFSDQIDELGILQPRSTYPEHLEAVAKHTMPLVLSNVWLDGGQQKYVLDNAHQIKTAAQFFRHYPDDASPFKVSEFIETPSDRYTSFRVLVDGSGTLLAAGLLYSRHECSARKRMPESQMDLGYSEHPFDSPDSPYFLQSRDFRSNMRLGGTVIPLVGEFAGHSKSNHPRLESEILLQHGITPESPQIPIDIAEQARAIGQLVCQQSSLFIGVDFLMDTKRDREAVFLELNTYAGSGTYHACHHQNEPFDQTYYRACMQARAIEHIVKGPQQ